MSHDQDKKRAYLLAALGLEDRLLNYWPLRDKYITPTSLFKDLGSLALHGTAVNGIVPGPKSTEFNGNDHYVLFTPTSYPVAAGEVTFSFWLKRNDDETHYIMSNSVSGSGFNHIRIVADTIRIESNTNGDLASGIVPVFDNKMHHYVITCSGGITTFYEDLVDITTGSAHVDADDLVIDSIGNDLTSTLNGSLTDVRIYNRTLSADDMAVLFDAGPDGQLSNQDLEYHYLKQVIAGAIVDEHIQDMWHQYWDELGITAGAYGDREYEYWGPDPWHAFQFSVETTGTPENFALPLVSSGTYNFNVNWGDGNIDAITAYDDAAVTHSYATPGTYLITITGTLIKWVFDNNAYADLVRNVFNWGPLQPHNGNFYGCNFAHVLDTGPLNLAGATSLFRFFRGWLTMTTIDISAWDTSKITSFERLFQGCDKLAFAKVSNLNTSGIGVMTRVFSGCTALENLDLSNWDVTTVISFADMFLDCDIAFTTELYDALLISWAAQDVTESITIDFGPSAVYTPGGAAEAARLVLTGTKLWTITDGGPVPFQFTVETTGTPEDFALPLISSGTYDFNVDWGDSSNDDITAYDDAAVTHSYATPGTHLVSIRGTLTKWQFNNDAYAPLMRNIFSWGNMIPGTTAFYGCTGLTVTATDKLILLGANDLTSMFRACSALTSIDVSTWDMTGVTTIVRMFQGTGLTYIDVSNWDTSGIGVMSRVFLDCSVLENLDLSNWDISTVIDFTDTFKSADIAFTTELYDALLIAWAKLDVVESLAIDFGPSATYTLGGTGPPTAESSRTRLTDSKLWTITDGGGV